MKILYTVKLEQDPKAALDSCLLNPHYSNSDFREGAQAIFLDPQFCKGNQGIKNASYDYSDRICNWFTEEVIDKARQVVHDSVVSGEFKANSAVYYEAWLRYLYDDPKLQLVHLLSGVNRSNGYPYLVYGYIKSK